MYNKQLGRRAKYKLPLIVFIRTHFFYSPLQLPFDGVVTFHHHLILFLFLLFLQGDFTRTGERKIAGVMKDGYNSANR